jgi:hypothetical protein
MDTNTDRSSRRSAASRELRTRATPTMLNASDTNELIARAAFAYNSGVLSTV